MVSVRVPMVPWDAGCRRHTYFGPQERQSSKAEIECTWAGDGACVTSMTDKTCETPTNLEAAALLVDNTAHESVCLVPE